MVKKKNGPFFKNTLNTVRQKEEVEEDDDGNAFDDSDTVEDLTGYNTADNLLAAMIANIFGTKLDYRPQKTSRQGSTSPFLYARPNDYYRGGYSTTTGYTDGIRFSPKKDNRSSQSKKVSNKKSTYDHQQEALDNIPDFIIIGLYLMLRSKKMSKQSLLYYYRDYLGNFVERDNIDRASHTLLTFKGIVNTKDTLTINQAEWEGLLTTQYDHLFTRLTTPRTSDMFTYALTSLKEVDQSVALAPLINKTLSVVLNEGKIITQNGEILAKIVKQLITELPRLLPEKLVPDYFLTRLIEYIFILILECKFITFKNGDTATVLEPFFTFITLPPENQQMFLQEKIYALLHYPVTHQSLSVRLDYDHLTLYNYLNTYLNEQIRTNSKDHSCIILRAELLFDLYQGRIERGDYVPYLRFKESDIELITNDYRPKISNFYNPDYPNMRLRLEHVLKFELALGGIVHPLVNADNTIVAYKFLPPATKPVKISSSKKENQAYKNKGIVLPDFTIKMEAKTIDPQVLLKWLKYTELVTLDTIIELKITKQSVWKYLEQDTVNNLLTELNDFSENKLPQNVESSIESC